MIAKRSPTRNDGGSNFKALADYITDQKNNGDKVEAQTITNCQSENRDWALLEIEKTQAKNTRAIGDKTYHLIISFREDEKPDPEQLKDIEETLCKSIGLGDHQRISAVHTDTDNLHIHVAINKIHPETFRMVEPYYDHYKIGEVCQALEAKHGLQVDNHSVPGQVTDRKAIPVDEMRAGGLVPLADWIAERVDANKTKKWQSLHKELAGIGVELRPRGNGFAFVDLASGTAVKASAVNRSFSKGRLVETLGEYQAPNKQTQAIKPKELYQAGPVNTGTSLKRVELFQRFTTETASIKSAKAKDLAALKEQQKEALAAIKNKYQVKRLELRHGKVVSMRKTKKGFQSLLKAERLKEIERVKAEIAKQRETINKQHGVSDWRGWLAEQAGQGDTDALEALRFANRKGDPKKNSIKGESESHSLYQSYQYHIHRDGKVTYQIAGEGFTDEGKRLTLGKMPGDEALAAAIKMAVQKYGNNLTIGGSDEFIAKASALAIKHGAKVGNVVPNTENKPVSAKDPIQDYINERNEKSTRIFDIMKHRLYNKSDVGTVEVAGLRRFDGVKAVLLKLNNEILVLKISDSQYRKLKSVKNGSTIKVDARGRVSAKGVER